MSMAEAPRPASPESSSPIEATLRILLSSVPYLIGAAVVRHGSRTESVAAEVGRVPWLFDQRLTQLELSDDALPPNRPVLLDWPVPTQAEWVGVPPRLLIARLVAFERTAGILLGTLITREQLEPRTREAVELSCQLLASAVATETLLRESEQEARRLRVLNELQRALSSSLDARALGRVLRDAMIGIVDHVVFSVSLFHPQREEVAYRYRAADVDALGNELGRRPVEDGPNCGAARRAERVVFAREVELPREGDTGHTQRRAVSVVQFPLLVNEGPIGIVSVQAFRTDGFTDEELGLAQALVDTSVNYFAHARRIGVRKPQPEEPRFTQVTGAAPVPPAPAAPVPEDASAAPAAPLEPSREPVPLPGSVERGAEKVVRELLAACVALGQQHAFVVRGERGSSVLRGHARSDAPFMAELDEAIGLTRGTFVIGVDDHSNAIARSCREARIVSVAWIYEILQPIIGWEDALVLERRAGGGRCIVVPIQVAGDVAGALVVGPTLEEPPAAALERLVAYAEAAASDLAALTPEASRGGEPRRPSEPEENVLRVSLPRELGPTA